MLKYLRKKNSFMTSSLISITLSIIAAFIYDAVKKAYTEQKSYSDTETSEHSPKYILSVKREFYIGFFAGIAFTSIPNTQYSFLNLGFDILSYFSFFIALMGFMCLVDVVNHMSDKASNDNAKNGTKT